MNWRYLGYFALALLIIHIPFVGPFFRIANTLIHESSHAIVALLMRGQVLRIELFANTEGVTYTASATYAAALLTSAAGYVGSSIAALGLAVLCAKGRHAVSLWLFVILGAVNLILWVRNPFGMVWLAVFIVVLLYALRRKGKWTSALSIGLFAFVLAESVSSSFAILWLSLNTPAGAGDAANLARETPLPAGFWGIIFMLQACILGFMSARIVLRKRANNR
ncbi:M50 family metallopeptidase [Paenibacillus sp. R14(2021)]|uniref:M50 family metallopeptidase n=1 Tax=Paenibacillus sp. R14(2021) TaxID=2859228 RepID=UPI001C614C64|nr:M50 family metallopeptidase [Paenibacillus sp. R14(2021)]